jgi:hypothetical protein
MNRPDQEEQRQQEERDQQEQMRQEQERMQLPRGQQFGDDNESSTNPVIINH